MKQLLPCSYLMIAHCFTCGERKIWQNIKSQNIMKMIVGTNLKFYTSVAKMLKLKVRMLWRLNPVFVEVNGEKLIGVGSFLDSPILNRVNIKMYLPYFFYFIITDFKRMIPFLWYPRIYLKQNIWKNESQRKLFFARFKTEVNHTERNFFLCDYGSGKRRLSKNLSLFFS